MTTTTSMEIFDRNRVILCHFDSYSALLLFARFGKTTLLPAPLPEDISGLVPLDEDSPLHMPEDVVDALVEQYGLNPDELICMGRFNEWVNSDGGPVRVHLVRINTFEPPKALLEKYEGRFQPISEMRGIPPHELGYVRRVFDIIVGGA